MGSSAVMYATTAFVNIFKNMGLAPITAWRIVFAIFAIIGGICLTISAFAFHEPDYIKETSRPTDSIFKSLGIVLKNKNFVIFSLGDLASNVSMAFFQTSMLYYITILLNIKESVAFVVMACAIATAIALFPLIVKISKKYNKKVPLLIGTCIFAVVFTFIYFANDIAALVPGYELLWV